MKNILLIASAAAILSACGGVNRKVIVYTNGTPKVEGNTITVGSGSSHNSVDLYPTETTITAKLPGDVTKSFTIEGDGTDGLFILNLKNDTLIGSYQPVGAEVKQERITQENLQMRIDSIQQLMSGANVSEAKRNFCIAPGQLTRITANKDAQVVGPFLTMPGSFAGNPEVYKFYTNREARENVERLKKMLSPAEEKN